MVVVKTDPQPKVHCKALSDYRAGGIGGIHHFHLRWWNLLTGCFYLVVTGCLLKLKQAVLNPAVPVIVNANQVVAITEQPLPSSL